jgi:hypothetical protein
MERWNTGVVKYLDRRAVAGRLASFGALALDDRWQRQEPALSPANGLLALAMVVPARPKQIGFVCTARPATDWVCLYNRPGWECCSNGTRRRPPATGSRGAPPPLRFAFLVLLHATSAPRLGPNSQSASPGRNEPALNSPPAPRQWPTHRQRSVHNIVNQLKTYVNGQQKIICRLNIDANLCPTRTKRPPQRNVAQPLPAVTFRRTLAYHHSLSPVTLGDFHWCRRQPHVQCQ